MCELKKCKPFYRLRISYSYRADTKSIMGEVSSAYFDAGGNEKSRDYICSRDFRTVLPSGEY